MSQIDTGSSGAKPTSNVYTMLMLITIICLGIGAGYIGYKNIEITPDDAGNNPFYVMPSEDGSGR
ncbi:MAG: hypothetical protein R3336_03355 [Phycisphaeraceae bacterium]|nr:hypothetical protein [Phycisphaeraceae bacterium]